MLGFAKLLRLQENKTAAATTHRTVPNTFQAPDLSWPHVWIQWPVTPLISTRLFRRPAYGVDDLVIRLGVVQL